MSEIKHKELKPKSTGAKIRQLRLQNGYTLEELGQRVGVGASTVRKWEVGMIKNIKTNTLIKIAEAFNVPPTYFLDIPNTPKPALIKRDAASIFLTKEEQTLINLYRGLNGDDALDLLMYAKNLNNKIKEANE